MEKKIKQDIKFKENHKTKKATLDEYKGLNPKNFSRIKQEYHDIDYIDQLNEEQLAFMSSFMDETLGTNFKRNKKKITKTLKAKRQLYRENNDRNFDMYGRARAGVKGNRFDSLPLEATLEDKQIKELGHDEENEDFGVLTKTEFLRLIKDEAEIPKEMKEFYIKFYNLSIED